MFTQTLRKGSRGDEVADLQELLKELGHFTYPEITAFFGEHTEEAVKSFQCKEGIICNGTPESTGYGVVGPMTRKLLNAKVGSAPTLKQALVPPLNSMRRTVSQPFGVRNPRYKSGIHAGVDYAVPIGTKVYAPADGEITAVWRNHASMGNACLYKFHANGLYTMRLLHLKSVPKPGRYRRGAVIAETGNTGMSTGPHLHLELWRGEYTPETLSSATAVRQKLPIPSRFSHDYSF